MQDLNYGWVVEMQIKATMKGSRVIEVPVSYRRRIGTSKVSGTIRGVVGAGTKILLTIFRAALGQLNTREQALPPYRVIQFTRYPEPGSVKTRLIPALDSRRAAELHRQLSEHTFKQVAWLSSQDNISAEIRFTGGSREEMRNWLGHSLFIRSQGSGDLGDRMARAIHSAFQEGCMRILVVGSDCPGLTGSIMSRSLSLLGDTDVVLGPATDGGYYLIGLRRDTPELFQNIDWGTDRVLEQTLNRIESLGLKKAILEELDDIDRPEDLYLWEETSKGV
jgi:rSAM/selenodomain-associated transferase 1